MLNVLCEILENECEMWSNNVFLLRYVKIYLVFQNETIRGELLVSLHYVEVHLGSTIKLLVVLFN